MLMGGGTQLILDNEANKPYIEIIDNKIISNDGIEQWDISNDIPNTDPEIVGEIYGWGDNRDYVLGIVSTGNIVTRPLKIGNTIWKNIMAGVTSSVFATSIIDNKQYAWGYNNQGQLGQNDDKPSISLPIEIKHNTKWRKIVGGDSGTFALDEQNNLYAWGKNFDNVFSDSTYGTTHFTPIKLNNSKWKDIVSDLDATFALCEDGYWYSWGRNNYGQLGRGFSNARGERIARVDRNWRNVYVRYQQTTAILDDGYLYAFGFNENKQLGVGSTNAYHPTPIRIGGTKWQLAVCAVGHSLALSEDGYWYGWGNNDRGQLGLGHSYSVYLYPVRLNHQTKWKYISTQGSFVCAQTPDNDWYGWGDGHYGEFGLGASDTHALTPIKLSDTKWKNITVGNRYCMAVI